MKNISISISKEDVNKSFKTSVRKTMIDLGVYNIHKNRTFKSKKTYTRKDKSYQRLRNLSINWKAGGLN